METLTDTDRPWKKWHRNNTSDVHQTVWNCLGKRAFHLSILRHSWKSGWAPKSGQNVRWNRILAVFGRSQISAGAELGTPLIISSVTSLHGNSSIRIHQIVPLVCLDLLRGTLLCRWVSDALYFNIYFFLTLSYPKPQFFSQVPL